MCLLCTLVIATFSIPNVRSLSASIRVPARASPPLLPSRRELLPSHSQRWFARFPWSLSGGARLKVSHRVREQWSERSFFFPVLLFLLLLLIFIDILFLSTCLFSYLMGLFFKNHKLAKFTSCSLTINLLLPLLALLSFSLWVGQPRPNVSYPRFMPAALSLPSSAAGRGSICQTC